MPSRFLAPLRADIAVEFGRIRQVEFVASVLTVVLIGLFDSLISWSVDGTIWTLYQNQRAGLDFAEALRVDQTFDTFHNIFDVPIAILCGTASAVLAIGIARMLLPDCRPTSVCLLSSFIMLAFGLGCIGMTNGVREVFPADRILAGNLPGWILGLYLGRGRAARLSYRPRIIGSLWVTTAVVVLVIRLAHPFLVPTDRYSSPRKGFPRGEVDILPNLEHDAK